MVSSLHVLKGHGTQNDFVLIPDPDDTLDLTPGLVSALCDRHAGLGADGVLHVVRTERAGRQADGSTWFMDYRNADGSVAEMCGNGIRVMAAYLRDAGLLASGVVQNGSETIGTRGGPVRVAYDDDGLITVDMGPAASDGQAYTVTVADDRTRPGRFVAMPNPHVVVEVPGARTLAALDLSVAPDVAPVRPDGQNVEFVVRAGPRHLRMRVHERGVGETRSCGTGICAAVVAAAGRPDGEWWQVDVPGGRCHVRWRTDGHVELRGPAVVVAEVDVDLTALGPS